MAKIPHRFYLTEEQMPTQWYNLRADMKEQPDPMLNPATLEPVKAQRTCIRFLRGAGGAGDGQHHALYRYPGRDPGNL